MYVLTFGSEYGYETHSIGPFNSEIDAWQAGVIELRDNAEPERFRSFMEDFDLEDPKEICMTYYEVMQADDQSVSVTRLDDPETIFDHKVKYLGAERDVRYNGVPPNVDGYQYCMTGTGPSISEAYDGAVCRLEVPEECVRRRDLFYEKFEWPHPLTHCVAIYYNNKEAGNE